jgi:hypothetical protein
MNLKGLLNGLARRQAVWRVRMGVQGIENSVLFAVESELQEQFGSAAPAEPLSHSDSLPLPPTDAHDFSQPARGNFANTAVEVLSALLAIGRRALSWISPRPPSSLNP